MLTILTVNDFQRLHIYFIFEFAKTWLISENVYNKIWQLIKDFLRANHRNIRPLSRPQYMYTFFFQNYAWLNGSREHALSCLSHIFSTYQIVLWAIRDFHHSTTSPSTIVYIYIYTIHSIAIIFSWKVIWNIYHHIRVAFLIIITLQK